jgi:hypothetical protein
MSTPTAFYITVTTEAELDYTEVASALVEAFHTVTTTKLAEFTKPHLANPWCEVEVSKEDTVVQACAILLAWAPKAWSLDKNKLTTLLRTELPFTVKLMKRSVDKNELEEIIERASEPQDQPA